MDFAPVNPVIYDKRVKIQLSKTKLLFFKYFAAALVEDTTLRLSSTRLLIFNPYVFAVVDLNCQNPTAFEEETASDINELSCKDKYLKSVGIFSSSRISSITGKYIFILSIIALKYFVFACKASTST